MNDNTLCNLLIKIIGEGICVSNILLYVAVMINRKIGKRSICFTEHSKCKNI